MTLFPSNSLPVTFNTKADATLYIMYQPPGESDWVPLKDIVYHWNFQLKKVGPESWGWAAAPGPATDDGWQDASSDEPWWTAIEQNGIYV